MHEFITYGSAVSNLTEKLRAIASEWRMTHEIHGIVLIQGDSVRGWKTSLQDAYLERPGVYAVDDDGHVFVAAGGNLRSGAKCWVVVGEGCIDGKG